MGIDRASNESPGFRKCIRENAAATFREIILRVVEVEGVGHHCGQNDCSSLRLFVRRRTKDEFATMAHASLSAITPTSSEGRREHANFKIQRQSN